MRSQARTSTPDAMTVLSELRKDTLLNKIMAALQWRITLSLYL